jgi:hypothetical protein
MAPIGALWVMPACAVQVPVPVVQLDQDVLWAGTASLWLARPLWRDKASYSGGAMLMVPLHAAYGAGDPDQIREFQVHFQALAAAWIGDAAALDPVPLDQLQYLYLASQFLGLEQRRESGRAWPWTRLESLMAQRIAWYWREAPAIHWSGKTFTGMRERVAWKLGPAPAAQGFHKGINDDELFLFAIAGDLARLLDQRGAPRPPFLDEILASARAVYGQLGRFGRDGGWLFQPGVWSDHPDDRYAATEQKPPDQVPAPVPGLSWDSSHSHRFPLWLRSLRDAEARGGPGWMAYDRMLHGLTWQFVHRVLVPPGPGAPYYRLTNYLDGRNGLYRWNSGRLGTGQGYGPFELSGTFLLGWWSFLDAPEIRKAYAYLAEHWPPGREAMDTYAGPPLGKNDPREFQDPTSRAVRFRELIVRLVADHADLLAGR